MATKKPAAKAAPKKNKLPELSTNQKVGIGIGLTAAAVAAAGTYFLYGSENAAKNRGKVKSWTLKAKAEILEKLETAQEMTHDEYEKLVDTVSGAYSRLKDASKVDIVTFKKEMKSHWSSIEKMAKPAKKAPAKKAAAKKATPAKKAVAKKAPAKKAVAKKVAAKKK